MAESVKQLDIALTTTSGEVNVQVTVPTALIRVTDIVPVMRSMGEQAQAVEISSVLRTGKEISCKKGCSACCERILVPVSPPEAFALGEMMSALPIVHRQRIEERLVATRERLDKAGVLSALQDLAESPTQRSDEDIDPINRAYYALRLPCIFLEDGACSIYEHRPAACREYLVTSPPELCQDTEKNPVEELSNPLRAGTVLSILWAKLMGGPVRLIPLPVVFEWVERHRSLLERTWNGLDLFDQALEGLGKFLKQSLKSTFTNPPNDRV